MAKFTHLHVHSEYSLLDGLAKIEDLCSKALELGMDSLALTDHGVMYGIIKFFLTAKEFGIKPIIGMEAYVAARSRLDKQANVDSDRSHLILLAKDEQGYKNLLKLTTLAHLEGFYYKPRIDMEILKKYSQGLVCSSACIEGEIPQLLIKDDIKKAEEKAKEMLEIFGKDFYLEIQDHPKIKLQQKANKGLVTLSRKLGIPLVATNDCHYVEKDDAEAQDALLAVQTQKMIKDENRLSMLSSPDFYLRSQEEMIQAFKDYPEAIKNTQEIAKKCNLEIPIGKWVLPNYPLPEGETANEHLKKLALERLKDRFPKPNKQVTERLNYELEVICSKGFATYFLIVQDFVNWAKANGVRVGPGRGSAAGSLVSYILRITSIDPLYHNLPFERFLNPQRPTPPDIDLDFADDRRDEVIEYVTERYGKDKVAQIITFNVMKAKESIRDIGRVMGMPYADPDKIAKLIPINMTIDQALKVVPELAAFNRQAEFKKLLELARKVEGVSRHASTHAAGVVVADKDLTEYTPLQKETKGERIITQYDMYSLDLNVSEKAIGLLKMDFLGLRNLTILEKALDYVRHASGKKIDLSDITLEDKEALAVIARGETTGIFQLESEGMRRLARKLVPNRFSDISAMVALYRPGPMQFINEFITGKKNPKKVNYPHPDLEPILSETYGIAVYQEQCLQIANVMGGYSLGEADILRRAIGKKKKSIMTKEKNKFIKRAVEKGYKQEIAEKVFGLIERFAGYGFNKAHSTSYAMIAYQTAYMKAHYPVEFMAALLTAESGSTGANKDEKVALAVNECQKTGIKVLPPDINKSKVMFTIEPYKDSLEGKAVRFGLGAIKNVGAAAITSILEARELGDDFKSLADFCHRVDQQKVNKKVLESLIKVGAMDRFGKRAALLSSLEKIRSKGSLLQKEKANGQTGLFDGGSDKQEVVLVDDLPEMEEFSQKELLSLEKSLLGFYLTQHPLNQVLKLIANKRSHQIKDLFEIERRTDLVKVGGIITQIRIVLTKSQGQEMAFVKIEDDTGSIDVVVFPKVFSRTKNCWVKDSLVFIKGRVQKREDNENLVVDEAKLLDDEELEEMAKQAQSEEKDFDFEVDLPSRISPRKLVELNKLLKQNQGKDKVSLAFIDNAGRKKRMNLSFGVDYSDKLKKTIKNLIEE